ncbi:salicylate hydroxylase [Pholiota conissans]|uniref:Salicylate hydroxylase n=1 Tax=Pholiota conissans TaxID=109636 RepID=A0A9P5Z189_9AGAR|nr:salicylate hydroxylase [Pholiota conissans]
MDTTPKLRLAIVGGGIGGLALAVALSHMKIDQEIQVDIYESAARITQVGAGITFWPRTWEILKDLGMEDDLVAYMNPGQELPSKMNPKLALCYRKSDGGHNIMISDMAFPGGSITFHRADVQQVLLKHISSRVRIYLSKRLASYHEFPDGIQLRFKDGESAICDMLIGADGINSVVRKGFLKKVYNLSEPEATEAVRPLWSGTVVYRSLIDSNAIRRSMPNHPTLGKPMTYCGKHKHIITYPVSQGRLINTLAFVSDPHAEAIHFEGPSIINPSLDNVSSFFKHWSKEVRCITDHMTKPSRWGVEMVRPLETYSVGRITLLGDAAHAMTTHLANGASQAIEDAYILAHILAKASTQGIFSPEKIGAIYSTIRQPFSNAVAKASLEQGRYYEFSTAEFEDVAEGDAVSQERLRGLAKEIHDRMEWMWNSSISGDVQSALSMA